MLILLMALYTNLLIICILNVYHSASVTLIINSIMHFTDMFISISICSCWNLVLRDRYCRSSFFSCVTESESDLDSKSEDFPLKFSILSLVLTDQSSSIVFPFSSLITQSRISFGYFLTSSYWFWLFFFV